MVKYDIRINADFYKLKDLVLSTKEESDFYLENKPEDNKVYFKGLVLCFEKGYTLAS